jgi:hypothetical protein
MSLFSQLGKAAADSLIGSMANAGGIGALLGGGLGGVKGLILPDAEVDEEGNPTGKRKGRLSSALRSGGMGAVLGGALGAGFGAKSYRHDLREELNNKHKDFVAKLNRNDDNKPLVSPYIDEAQKVKSKALFNFPRSTIGGPNDAAIKDRLKYMIDPQMYEYIGKQRKISEEAAADQIRLITEGLYDKADAKGKLRAISENSITSPTTLNMMSRWLNTPTFNGHGVLPEHLALPMPKDIEEKIY